MENISVSTILAGEDWSALQRASRARQWSSASPRRRLLMRVPFLLIAIAVASSVFVTACTDMCGFLVFLGLLALGLRLFA